jgi:hypothetical protein
MTNMAKRLDRLELRSPPLRIAADYVVVYEASWPDLEFSRTGTALGYIRFAEDRYWLIGVLSRMSMRERRSRIADLADELGVPLAAVPKADWQLFDSAALDTQPARRPVEPSDLVSIHAALYVLGPNGKPKLYESHHSPQTKLLIDWTAT